MRYSTFIAPLSLLAFSATAHAADCQPVFLGGDQSLTIDGVEIEPGGRATEDFQIRVRNSAGPGGGPPAGGPPAGGPPAGGPGAGPGGAGQCGAIIRIARLGATVNPDFPAYRLRGPGNQQIEILPDPTAGGTTDSDVVIANAPPGPEGRAVPFHLGVSTEWGLRAGTYTEQLELLLIDSAGNVADRKILTVTIVIPSAASLRLVGAVVGGEGGGPAQIDLGNLSSTRETTSQRFGARIFSTAPYIVTFQSANQGNLLHEQGREQIPYRLYFDGALVDLAGMNEFSYPDPTPKTGDRRPMRIVVPPAVALAGRYSDRITVTVTAM